MQGWRLFMTGVEAAVEQKWQAAVGMAARAWTRRTGPGRSLSTGASPCGEGRAWDARGAGSPASVSRQLLASHPPCTYRFQGPEPLADSCRPPQYAVRDSTPCSLPVLSRCLGASMWRAFCLCSFPSAQKGASPLLGIQRIASCSPFAVTTTSAV